MSAVMKTCILNLKASLDIAVNALKVLERNNISDDIAPQALKKIGTIMDVGLLSLSLSNENTLAPDERMLPELEEIKRGFTFILDIAQEELPHTRAGSAEVALRHIHRRALDRLNAIAKITPPAKEGEKCQLGVTPLHGKGLGI